MEALVKEQEALIREQKNTIMEQSLALTTIETRLSAVENMPKIAWALRPPPVKIYKIEGIVNNAYDLNGKFRIKIQGGSKMRIASNNRWKNKSLTPHENKWIQSWGDSSLIFAQPKSIWQKVEKTKDEKPIERVCNPRISLEWGWTSNFCDEHPVVPTADVASLGAGDDWVRVAIPKKNTYENKGSSQEESSKELIPLSRSCWKILIHLPGKLGENNGALPRVMAYAPAEPGKYPHEVWDWYTQVHLAGDWVKNKKIKITPVGPIFQQRKKNEIHSSTAKRLSEMVKEQQEMIDEKNEQLASIRLLARYEFAHKSAIKEKTNQITKLYKDQEVKNKNKEEELDEMRKKLQEALDEIDRKKKEIENVNIQIEEVKKERDKAKKEIRGPGRRVKQDKKAALPSFLHNMTLSSAELKAELAKTQKTKPKPKMGAPSGPAAALLKKQNDLVAGRLYRINRAPSMPRLPPPQYYSKKNRKEEIKGENVDFWNMAVPTPVTAAPVTLSNQQAILENRIISEARNAKSHRLKQDKEEEEEEEDNRANKSDESVIIVGAEGVNSDIINGRYTRLKGKNYIFSRGKVGNCEACLFLGFDKKWWVGRLEHGMKRVSSGWAHTINVVPGNKNARLLPQPQDVKRGDWEVLVGDNKWEIQSNVSINSLQR